MINSSVVCIDTKQLNSHHLITFIWSRLITIIWSFDHDHLIKKIIWSSIIRCIDIQQTFNSLTFTIIIWSPAFWSDCYKIIYCTFIDSEMIIGSQSLDCKLIVRSFNHIRGKITDDDGSSVITWSTLIIHCMHLKATVWSQWWLWSDGSWSHMQWLIMWTRSAWSYDVIVMIRWSFAAIIDSWFIFSNFFASTPILSQSIMFKCSMWFSALLTFALSIYVAPGG